jgi:hypothetical protein
VTADVEEPDPLLGGAELACETFPLTGYPSEIPTQIKHWDLVDTASIPRGSWICRTALVLAHR